MQAIECKANLSLSFSKAFAAYIQQVHQRDPALYAGELRQLDELRQEATSASSHALQKGALYYGQLTRVVTRFPMTDGTSNGIHITFSWYNFHSRMKKPRKPARNGHYYSPL